MYCPVIKDLPAVAEGKTGWPWTESSPLFADTMPDGKSWPKISIVTPNYNYGQFIEQTIRSVLLQGYPNLEYIIIDGGSTDSSIEVIRKYEEWLTFWISEPDGGQTEAINKGFAKATGEIVTWLCSDDLLLPQALYAVACQFNKEQEAKVVVGRCRRVYLNNKKKSWIGKPTITAINRIPVNHAFSQSACFFSRKLLDRSPGLDESYHYAMDLELWAYFKSRGAAWKVIDDLLSVYQIHARNKTSRDGIKITYELEHVYKAYVKERISLSYWHRLLRYPLERFLSRHPGRIWLFCIGPVWILLTLLLGIFYRFDRAWHMRWKRWA